MPADAPVLHLRALEAVLPGGDGVGPVDLDLHPGEAVLVMGPSGSGKTTLLRLLHGAVPQAVHADVTGTVAVAGRDVATTRVADLADVVGVVAQDPETGVCLSQVADEVALPLENLAVPRHLIGAAVDVALARVRASHLAERGTGALSGGELQRVALAAAVAGSPRLLLLDEPTAMLDAGGVAAVRDAVAAAREATGAACVLVEHRLDELADDGVVGLPERWLVLGGDGRVLRDLQAEHVTTADARQLLASGCWLPVDTELLAVLDRPGGLADAAVQTALRELVVEPARDGDEVVDERDAGRRSDPPDGRATVLVARGLAVGRRSAQRTRRGRRRVGDTTVLRDVDLDLYAGQTVALVGANGTGKSTLLACLAGVAAAAGGQLRGPRAGFVLQNPEHQFTATTVRAEVEHGLDDRDGRRSDRVEDVLARLGLSRVADRNPFRLSGGQQRRLSLAAMLVHDHPLLLADEPGFGLDRHAAVAVMRALRGVAAEGRAVLFSSHDLRAVAGWADRVLVIGDGRLLADTTPWHLLRDADLLVVAGLRPTRLLRWLAAETAGPRALPEALQRLDDAVGRISAAIVQPPVTPPGVVGASRPCA